MSPILSWPVGLRRLAAYAFAGTLLCAPAIWNGFPLVFDDVGGYLERWPQASLGLGRSTSYGLLLWTARSTWWVPVIVVQALVTVWTIDRSMAILGAWRSPWMLACVVVAIAATSGAALFVSQVMPDAWAAPAVLALYLLAWHGNSLTRTERIAMAAIVAFAGASHMAILGVLTGLLGFQALAWLGGHKLRIAPPGIVAAVVSVGCGVALMFGANLLVAGRFAPTPGGDIILFGRLVESGIVGKVLAQECPRNDWRFCAFRHEMPDASEDLLWNTNSPLYKIGGWDDRHAKHEIGSILARSVLTHPLEHLKDAASLTAEQLVSVGVADSTDRVATRHLRWTMGKYAPWLVNDYDLSRQQRGEIDLESWSAWVVAPMSIAATFALPVLAPLLWRAGHCRAATLSMTLFLVLLGNAFLCGVIAGANDRYQARIAWLAPFALTLAGAQALQESRRQRQRLRS